MKTFSFGDSGKTVDILHFSFETLLSFLLFPRKISEYVNASSSNCFCFFFITVVQEITTSNLPNYITTNIKTTAAHTTSAGKNLSFVASQVVKRSSENVSKNTSLFLTPIPSLSQHEAALKVATMALFLAAATMMFGVVVVLTAWFFMNKRY